MSDPTIPNDVLAEIVAIFARRKDTEQIKKLSSVSWFCLHQCRKHLFSTIGAGYRRGLKLPRISQFVRLILDHPDAAPYIHTLALYISFELKDEILQKQLAKVLPMLTSLSSLRIADHELGRTSWTCVSNSILSTLPGLLSLPTFHSLDLESFKDFPLAVLHDATSLRSLSLYKVQLQTGRGGDEFGRKKIETVGPQIKSTATITGQQKYPPLSQLKSFRLWLETPDTFSSFIGLFQEQAICSLEELSMDIMIPTNAGNYDNDFGEQLSSIIVPQASTLRILKLYTDIGLLTHNPHGGVCAALAKFEKTNNLASLLIHSTLLGDSACTLGHEWAALSDVLTLPIWEYLKKVEIIVTVQSIQVSRTTDTRMEQVFNLRRTHLAPLFTKKHPFQVEFKVLLDRGSRVVEALTEVSLYT